MRSVPYMTRPRRVTTVGTFWAPHVTMAWGRVLHPPGWGTWVSGRSAPADGMPSSMPGLYGLEVPDVWTMRRTPGRRHGSAHETVGAVADGMGKERASASIAVRTSLASRRHGWIVTLRCCRCQT